MSASAVRHQYRHYRTLIVLVLAMTAGTVLLFWLARFSPVTPLRSTASSGRTWSQISVRAECVASSHGFFHYRIDENGRLFQSHAWQVGQAERSSPKTVQILLTCADRDAKISSAQTRMLSRLISQLCQEHGIPADRVFVEASRGVADRGEVDTARLRRT